MIGLGQRQDVAPGQVSARASPWVELGCIPGGIKRASPAHARRGTSAESIMTGTVGLGVTRAGMEQAPRVLGVWVPHAAESITAAYLGGRNGNEGGE